MKSCKNNKFSGKRPEDLKENMQETARFGVLASMSPLVYLHLWAVENTLAPIPWLRLKYYTFNKQDVTTSLAGNLCYVPPLTS